MPTCKVKTKSSEGSIIEFAGPSNDEKNAAAFTVFLGPQAFTHVHAERNRQNEKRHTSEEDDKLKEGQLHTAAMAVLANDPKLWPFEGAMKLRARRDQCKVAAALLIAEMERIDRVQAAAKGA